MQKVWYRKSKNIWFATIVEQGRQKRLRLLNAPHTRDGKKLAGSQLVRELAARNIQPEPAGRPDTPACPTVAHIFRGFLKYSRQEHTPATADWYEDLLQGFLV
jgi:hypothetical protein